MVWRTLSNDCLVPIDGMGGLPWYGERYHNDCLVPIDGMGWLPWYGERYHNDCLVPIDGMGGLPWYGERYPMIALSRSMGWADCHGMENVIQ